MTSKERLTQEEPMGSDWSPRFTLPFPGMTGEYEGIEGDLSLTIFMRKNPQSVREDRVIIATVSKDGSPLFTEDPETIHATYRAQSDIWQDLKKKHGDDYTAGVALRLAFDQITGTEEKADLMVSPEKVTQILAEDRERVASLHTYYEQEDRNQALRLHFEFSRPRVGF